MAMITCPNCGLLNIPERQTCKTCGAQLPRAQQAPPVVSQPVVAAPPTEGVSIDKKRTIELPIQTSSEITSNDRLYAALSYIFTPLAPLLFLLMEETKNRSYSRYHAIQALGFLVAAFIYEVIASVIFTCGTIITFGFGGLVLWLLFFLPLPLMLYYAYKASTGEYFDIPVVTQMMIQQGWLRKP